MKVTIAHCHFLQCTYGMFEKPLTTELLEHFKSETCEVPFQLGCHKVQGKQKRLTEIVEWSRWVQLYVYL